MISKFSVIKLIVWSILLFPVGKFLAGCSSTETFESKKINYCYEQPCEAVA